MMENKEDYKIYSTVEKQEVEWLWYPYIPYGNAYIYTLPSDLEGMPLSLLEAMSYGNCCLVSDIPECVEVVEDKALVFKKSDTEDLRTTLQKACEHPEHVAELKQTAADFICQKYNWDNVVEETVKLYRSE